MRTKKRILFVSENVTLAQVVRLKVLADGLDRARYEVSFACSQFDPLIFQGSDFTQRPLYTLPPAKLFRAMERGQRLYELSTLKRYVKEELQMLRELEPDLIVGDLRLSLAISAPVYGVPYAALINAYWSPYAIREGFPLPDHPIVSWLGPELAARHFQKALPFVFNYFAKPINTLRRSYGLPSIGSMPEVLCHGDFTLYPDVPELTPTIGLPASHSYLGPVIWSPDLPTPPVLRELQVDRPCIYVTLGSSGKLSVLPTVLTALADLPVQVLLATAGRCQPAHVPANVQVADYLPGTEAARRSALVICNGGSSTGYQAIAEGVPVLGIPSNLDQYLAMTAIERAQAGLLLRTQRLTPERVRAAVLTLLHEPLHRAAAQRLATTFARYDAKERFADFVARAASSGDGSRDLGEARDCRLRSAI